MNSGNRTEQILVFGYTQNWEPGYCRRGDEGVSRSERDEDASRTPRRYPDGVGHYWSVGRITDVYSDTESVRANAELVQPRSDKARRDEKIFDRVLQGVYQDVSKYVGAVRPPESVREYCDGFFSLPEERESPKDLYTPSGALELLERLSRSTREVVEDWLYEIWEWEGQQRRDGQRGDEGLDR